MNLKISVESSAFTIHWQNQLCDVKLIKKYVDPEFIDTFLKGKFSLNKIRKYFEMVGRVNVRIFDQVGTLLVKVDAADTVSDIHGFDDASGTLACKRAHASLCA